MRRAARALALTAVGTLLAGGLSGCAVNVADLPLPTPGAGGASYRLTAVFADALNLPDGAHVKLNGDDIGRVQDIEAKDYTARVAMDVRQDVRLPVGTTAELRQATPLGEVFVALHPPPDTGGPVLADGAVIERVDTEAAASVEDLLASLSALVNGGGLAQVQTIVRELNVATEGRAAQIAHLLGQTTAAQATLQARTADFDRLLAASERLSTTLDQRRDTVDRAFDELTPGITELADQTDRLTRALTAAGQVSGTADEVIGRSDEDIRTLVGDIGPVLDGFADTAPVLGPSLRDVVRFGRVFEQVSKGESAAQTAVVSLEQGLFAVPRPGDRLPGPNDFVDGQQSFAQYLQHQFSTLGNTR